MSDETPAAVDAEAGASEASASPEPETRHGAIVGESRGQTVLFCTRENWVEVAEALRAEGYSSLVDLTAVDYLTYDAPRHLPAGIDPERFEVVAVVVDVARARRLRLRVQVPADDPRLPTLFDVWPGVENLEREVYDMFGITFTDHPDLSRILMPEDWIGHPLRKDHEIGRIPVQFKAPDAH